MERKDPAGLSATDRAERMEMIYAQLPDDAARVWRYTSFARFVWMLQKKQLWLSRIDLLGDPWELALAGSQLEKMLSYHPLIDEPMMQFTQRHIKRWRLRTFVSCWSASDHESHALWKIYCGSSEGVALQTTLGRLRQSVNNLPVRRVTYCEPGSRDQFPFLSQLATEKRPMFAYEQEVRVVFKAEDTGDVDASTVIAGRGLEWDPQTALENVWVHPDADSSFMETVKGVVENYAPALTDRVLWSRMQSRPLF